MKDKDSTCYGPANTSAIKYYGFVDDASPIKNPKCLGYKYLTDCGYEYDCGYDTTLDCDDCKYGFGRKDPDAKCNRQEEL